MLCALSILMYAVGFVLALLLAYIGYQYYMFYWSCYKNIPCRPPRLLFGNLWDVEKDNSKLWQQFKQWHATWAKDGVMVMWFGHQPAGAVTKPEHVEALLGSSELLLKDSFYDPIRAWLGDGLLVSRPAKWRLRRKLITPAFHFNILETFVPIINEHAEVLAEIVEPFAGRQPIDMFAYAKRCTLDVICEAAMGKRVDAQRQPDSEYVRTVGDVAQLIMNRLKQPLFQWDVLYDVFGEGRLFRRKLDVLHAFTLSVIRDRRAALGDGASPPTGGPQPLLDMLLTATQDNGQPLSDADVREEVDTFMFAGHDTTATLISWTMFMLALHPREQQKVFDELDAIFGSSLRPATSADIRSMKYLECVAKETLRLYPPVPLYGRELSSDLVLGDRGQYRFKRGAKVGLFVFVTHTDPELYPEPDVFRPERFLPENCRDRHPYAYFPFSAGPRNCIGQKFAMLEEKVVLSTILRRFRLSTPLTAAEVPPVAELVFRPSRPLLIRFDYRVGSDGANNN